MLGASPRRHPPHTPRAKRDRTSGDIKNGRRYHSPQTPHNLKQKQSQKSGSQNELKNWHDVEYPGTAPLNRCEAAAAIATPHTHSPCQKLAGAFVNERSNKSKNEHRTICGRSNHRNWDRKLDWKTVTVFKTPEPFLKTVFEQLLSWRRHISTT